MIGKDILIKIILQMESVSPKLDTTYGPFPTKGGDGGDDILWNGLLASQGFDPAYSQVVHCQAGKGEKRAGMFYRNPLRRFNDNAGHEHYFSRDMSLGVLLGYISKQYSYLQISGEDWLSYINANRACAVEKPNWLGGGCLIRSPMYRFAPDDDRSNITPNIWALMGRVWQFKDWHRANQMFKHEGHDGDINTIEAQVVPRGYQLHLKAVQAYIKFKIGQSRAMRKKVSKICYSRQPDNFFYKILSQEGVYQEDVDRYIETCPDSNDFESKDYWLWEKSEQNIKYSCGWDWVFLGRFILSFL